VTLADARPGITAPAFSRAEAGVATASGPATDAAVAILRAGGNAVDAAVAAAFALAVCEPSGSGLGGQASVLVAVPGGGVSAIDGHSVAPAGVSRATVTRAQQRTGYAACTVPSTAAVLGHAHARWGVLPWPEVLVPAIALARDGHEMTKLGRRQLRWVARSLTRDPVAAEIFLPGGRVPRVGDMLRQPGLARTLTRLAAAGAQDFYTGQLSRTIVAEMAARGGLITAQDLAAAAGPQTRTPLWMSYGGHTIATMPAPAGGLAMLLALRTTLEMGSGSGEDAHWAMLAAVSTRAAHRLRDRLALAEAREPDSPPEHLLEEMIRRTLREAARFQPQDDPAAGEHPAPPGTGEEPGDTTHLSVTDGSGMTVALTASIQSLFGAKVAAGGLGFVWNNYLRTCPRRRSPYRLGPGCRPRSNAAPTIVLNGSGAPILAIGAAGSRRITSALVQVLTSVLERGTSLPAALGAARMHATTSALWVERPLVAQLPAGVGPVRVRQRHAYAMGAVQAVLRHPDRSVCAAADPRREGTGTTTRVRTTPPDGRLS
jgi:gamma-glutamyltranspeptidase / glutathione hydrolase